MTLFPMEGLRASMWGSLYGQLQQVQRPKSLGVLDLMKFNIALRHRRPWKRWRMSGWPSTSIQPDTNATEDVLFKACTKVTLGDGQTVKFWTDRWLGGRSPKKLAPALFCIATRKNFTVARGLQDGWWKRGLRRIWTIAEVEEFIRL
jgi:hypothetical protein